MGWKKEITKQLIQATNQRKIGSPLKSLVKLLLTGDTRFNLLYSKSRDQYIYIIFREDLTKKTSKLLLQNGYKKVFLNNK